MFGLIQISGGGGYRALSGNPWRLTIGLLALIAVAAVAVFSLSSPVKADEGDETRFGSCSSEQCARSVGTASVSIRGLKAVQVSAGSDHVYALTAQGALVSWGSSADGRRDTPTRLVWRGNDQNNDGDPDYAGNRGLVNQQPIRWSQVAAGNIHTCAVTSEGDVLCWGDNSRGQTNIPVSILQNDRDGSLPNLPIAKIVAGGNHTCALENERMVEVSAMGGGTTAIPAGSIICWGDNSRGQTAVPGDPSDERRTGLPAGVAIVNGDSGAPDATGLPESAHEYVDVTAGANHTCAVRVTGIVDCWGDNSNGQSNVPRVLRNVQQAVITTAGSLVPSGVFHSVDAGDDYTCAINREGGALCWGANTGQSEAREYPPAGEYTQISAGRWHACALSTFDDAPFRRVAAGERLVQAPETATVDGVQISLSPTGGVDCWGSDLGTGRAGPPATIERVTTKGQTVQVVPWAWNQISAGGTFTCGIFNYDPTRDASPTPSRLSATATVNEGLVDCWGLIPSVPVKHTVRTATAVVPGTGPMVCKTVQLSEAYLPDGWGRIYGKPDADGTIEFGFMVVQRDRPDIWINPEFRFAPRSGSLITDRWYFSEWLTVEAYDDPAIGAKPGQCETQTLSVGRIAVRLLPTGHMELGILTADGGVALVPGDHNRITTPARPGEWWGSGFVQWRDAS